MKRNSGLSWVFGGDFDHYEVADEESIIAQCIERDNEEGNSKEMKFAECIRKGAIKNSPPRKLLGPLRMEICIIKKFPDQWPKERMSCVYRKKPSFNLESLVGLISKALYGMVIGETGEICEIGPLGEYFGPTKGITVKIEEIEEQLRSSEARGMLVLANGSLIEITEDDVRWAKNMAHVYCHKHKIPSVRYDEMESQALYGLWMASLRFDPKNRKKAQFRTFAFPRIRGCLADAKSAEYREYRNLGDFIEHGFSFENHQFKKLPGKRLKTNWEWNKSEDIEMF